MSLALAPARSGAWLEQPGLGVYVHIPFCRRRCHYCDFNTYEGLDHLHLRYVDALVRAIERASAPRPATSVFFGGGTPTLLPPHQLARALAAIRCAIGVEADAEITVEANPETVDEHVFEQLLAAGFNRFSIGVQSLAPDVLAGLGRTHSAERALQAVASARRAGAGDISIDLIYGSTWESSDDWRITLERAVDAGTDHISAYALTVEEGTPLATLVSTGRVADVDPDVQADRFHTARRVLSASGFGHYELSNWCKPQRASRHNLLYWSAGDYLGLGAGAHGHVGGRRYWNLRLPRDFIAAVARGATTEAGHETLTDEQRAGEVLMLGLRLRSGIDLAAFAARFGGGALAARAAAIGDLCDRGLLEREATWLRIADDAAFVSNEVAARLL